MIPFQQVYKSRAEAFRLFIAPQNLPVKQAKFYQDADRLGLVQTDKTVALVSLLAYVREELKINPTTGQSLVQRDDADEKAKNEARSAKAKADIDEMKAEEMKREQDAKWLHSDQAWSALAGILGTLRDALRHSANVAAPALVHLAAGDPQRSPEVYEGIEEMIFARAFNEVIQSGRVEVMFEKEKEDLGGF